MNFQDEKPKKRKMPIALVAVGIFLVACGGVGFVFRDSISSIISGTKSTNVNAGKPKFVFDTAKQPGWWTGGNNWPNPDDADDSAPQDVIFPISDISIHQCKVASRCKDPAKDTIDAHCFVMISYQKDAIDPQAARADTIEKNKEWGTDMQEVGIKTLTMDTPEGDKEYQLYQYDYKSKDGNGFKRGNAQGYIPLNDGHIDVRSVCDEADQLDETLPALKAVHLSVQ